MPTVHFYCLLCGSALQTSSEARYDLLRCDSCTRYVPVPRPAHGPENFASYPPVFPPEVLELLIKFQCTSCDAVLYTDARCEGREVVCSTCGTRTGIPRWSNVPDWSKRSETNRHNRAGLMRTSARESAPILSPEEIDFLRGMESPKPEAAA